MTSKTNKILRFLRQKRNKIGCLRPPTTAYDRPKGAINA
nr:MAG TPA: hypothetical protein [Caudoviricetes sp.]